MTAPSSGIKLLILVLSFEGEPFSKIQMQGQDSTFIGRALEISSVIRYVGRHFSLPPKYRLIFALRKLQYALLDFSQIFFVGRVLRLVTDLRFGDRDIQRVPTFGGNADIEEVPYQVSTYGEVSRLITKSPEDWSLIGLKTIQALRHVLDKYDFDFVFRTNTSSYLDVDLLKDYLTKLPKNRVYGGVVGKVFHDTEFASGAGILLSRDMVELICENSESWKHGLVDDVAIAEIIKEFALPVVPITPLPRLDLPTLDAAQATDNETIRNNFHFRCKSSSADETIKIMRYIHEVKRLTL